MAKAMASLSVLGRIRICDGHAQSGRLVAVPSVHVDLAAKTKEENRGKHEQERENLCVASLSNDESILAEDGGAEQEEC